MKAALEFLKYIYFDSTNDLAQILNAEANNDKQTVKKYLNSVKGFIDDLINGIE